MAEYIEKQAAIDAIREAENHAFNSFYKGLAKAHKIVVGLPPADVVPVVRCCDCKHLYKDGECPLRTWYTHVEDDFCSYGERKE